MEVHTDDDADFDMCKVFAGKILSSDEMRRHQDCKLLIRSILDVLSTKIHPKNKYKEIMHDLVFQFSLPYLEEEKKDSLTFECLEFVLFSCDHDQDILSSVTERTLKLLNAKSQTNEEKPKSFWKTWFTLMKGLSKNNCELQNQFVSIFYELLCKEDVSEVLFIQISSFLKDFLCLDETEKEGFVKVLKVLMLCGNQIPLFNLLALNTVVLCEHDILSKPIIWKILQEGLTAFDPLTRKRSLYIIKSLINYISYLENALDDVDENGSSSKVFWHPNKNKELWDIWKSFILIMETFEEKQIHVIKPALPLLCELYENTHTCQENSRPLFHYSWFLKVVHRAISHESKQLVKWVLQYFLALDLKHFSTVGVLEFVFQHLFETLKQGFLFLKDEGGGKKPVIFVMLQTFFKNFLVNIDEDNLDMFLSKFFGELTDNGFSDVSCSYLIIALSSVKSKVFSLSQEHIHLIKKFILCVQRSYRIEYQQIILQALAEFCCHSIDTNELVLPDIVTLFEVNTKVFLIKTYSAWFEWIKENQNSIEKKKAELKSIFEMINEPVQFSNKETLQCIFLLQLEFERTKETSIVSQYSTFLNDIIDCARKSPYFSNEKLFNVLSLANFMLKFVVNCDENLMEFQCYLPVINIFELIVEKISLNILEYFSWRMLCYDKDTESIMNESFVFLKLFVDLISTYPTNNMKYKRVQENIFETMLKNAHESLSNWTRMTFEKKFASLKCIQMLLLCNCGKINFLKELFELLCNEINIVKRDEVHMFFKSYKLITSSLYLEVLWENIQSLFKILLSVKHDAKIKEMFCDVYDSFTNDINSVSIYELFSLTKVSSCFIECFENYDEFEQICQSVWTVMNSQTHHDRSFWDIYYAGIDTILHKKLLLSDNENVKEMLKNYLKCLLEVGLQRSGIVNRVVENCLLAWNDVNSGNILCYESMVFFSGEIVQLLLFGNNCKKHQKVHNDFVDFAKSENMFELIELFKSSRELDQDVRRKIVCFLLSFNENKQTNDVIRKLVQLLINHDLNDCEKFRHMYFPNSERHRMKIRLWQSILVLISRLQPSFEYKECTRKIFTVLFFDNQPSVRRYIEWVLVIFTQMNSGCLELFWEYFRTGSEKKIVTVVSVLSMAFHLSKLFQGDVFGKFCEEAIPLIIPWTQAQHMTSRIHAQITLKAIWDKIVFHGSNDLQEKFIWVENFFTLTESNSAAVKHRNEASNNFFFSAFHPIEHYSIASIFHEVLSHTDILSDEFLLVQTFSEPCQNPQNHIVLKLYNDHSILAASKTKDKSPITSPVSPLLDMQKKIMPWNIIPSADDCELASELEKKRDSKISKLIVCAVLIDKTPNIGGLCRTCEIFGAEKLLVGSLRYLNDSQFKALSVSAEKWLTIEQVMPIKLGNYLEEMKMDGYTIVGVEQTAKSLSINNYKFKEKTVLVLGNEKTGIPVEVIQAVDVCVEIPQAGIIRSLNVHTSGALIIWEYSKQYLFI